MRWTRRVTRDSVLFVAGLVGIGYETLAQGGERPTLLILFGAMIGLPAFLKADERLKTDEKPPTVTPPGGQE